MLADLAGGSNFAVLAITTLGLSQSSHPRQILTSLLLTAWALRLSAFLFFRILKTGSDTRFDDKRDRFLPFLGFWVAQMLWVWIVSLPVTILNSPAVSSSYPQPAFGTGLDIAGLVLWTVGFGVESVSDVQKYRFKVAVQDRDPDRAAVCDVGVFGWSRHPNYFGEVVLQFGIFMLALSPSAEEGSVPPGSGPYAAQYASILGPVFLTVLLMFVSGLTLQERPGAKRRFEKGGEGWVKYQRWLQRTSILIPLPPALYVRLPVWVKRTLLLEFPIYVFDPEKHAEGKKKSGQDGEDQGRAAATGGGMGGDGGPSALGDTPQQQGRSDRGENLV